MSEGNPKIKAYHIRKMTGFCTAVFCGCAEEKALFRSKTNNRRLISIDSAVIQFQAVRRDTADGAQAER